MNVFDAEVRERKRLASNARHKKNGSKSKRCSLPTDHMTEKQWKERCGQVMEYKLNEPIPWAVFKAYPKDIQEMYIKNMVDKYHVTASDLGRLFGCHYGTVSRFCQQHGLQVPFAAGRRMSPEEKAAFQRLLAHEGPEETDDGPGFEAAPRFSAPPPWPCAPFPCPSRELTIPPWSSIPSPPSSRRERRSPSILPVSF